MCVCVCVLCLTLLSHGCADMRRWAHTLEHAARLNRACTTARWRAAGGGAVAGCACTHIVAGGAVGAPSAPSHLLDRKKVVLAGRRRELAIVCPWVIGRGGSYTSTAVTGIFTPARSTVVKKERRQPAGPQSFPRARVRRDEAPA